MPPEEPSCVTLNFRGQNILLIFDTSNFLRFQNQFFKSILIKQIIKILAVNFYTQSFFYLGDMGDRLMCQEGKIWSDTIYNPMNVSSV